MSTIPPGRYDQLTNVAPRYDGQQPINPNIFIDNPGEFLVKQIVIKLREVPQFAKIFGKEMDAYPRTDYGMRTLPALRVFTEQWTKEYESWFIDGDIYMDILLPAELRRIEGQEIPDLLASALLQQFRRPTFFNELSELVPGLNRLGSFFSINKAMAFEFAEKEFVPLTRITTKFRIDLRKWDKYLEETDRTLDSPFGVVIGDLDRVAGIIAGVNELNNEKVEIGQYQEIQKCDD